MRQALVRDRSRHSGCALQARSHILRITMRTQGTKPPGLPGRGPRETHAHQGVEQCDLRLLLLLAARAADSAGYDRHTAGVLIGCCVHCLLRGGVRRTGAPDALEAPPRVSTRRAGLRGAADSRFARRSREESPSQFRPMPTCQGSREPQFASATRHVTTQQTRALAVAICVVLTGPLLGRLRSCGSLTVC